MTKKAFCEDLHISTGNFGDWKRGKTAPSANKLIEIAKYFNVSLDWLMTGTNRGKEGIKEGKEPYFFDSEGQLNCRLEDLPEKEREFIKEYLKFVEYRRQQGNE
jgi:transcriptional regulator with XRE-family HTH domain